MAHGAYRTFEYAPTTKATPLFPSSATHRRRAPRPPLRVVLTGCATLLAAATVLFSARQTDLARLPVRLVDLSAAESATTSVSVVEVGSVRGDAATRYVIKDGWFCEDATSELNVLVASESEAGTVTAKDCRAACDAEPKCALFFGSDSGNCYLHEAGSAAAGTEWKDICTEFGKGYFVGHALAACADAPTVANGDADALASCAGLGPGASCPVTCADGYVSETDHVVCNDGVFEMAACEGKSCTAEGLSIPNADDNATAAACALVADGASCKLTCAAGFQPRGGGVSGDGLDCALGMLETTNVSCVPAGCYGMPWEHVEGVDESTMSVCVGADSGGTCDVVCLGGYVVGANVTSRQLTCDHGTFTLSDGTALAGSALCERMGCSDEPVLVGATAVSLEACKGTESGGECTIECNPGYVRSDADVAVCHKGVWRESATCKRMPCDAPAVAHMDNSTSCETSAEGMTQDGDTCDLVCAAGFELAGDSSLLTCTQGVLEPSTLACVEKDCGDFYATGVTDESIAACDGLAAGAYCEPECTPGLKAEPGRITCSEGEFSDFKCAEAPCKTVPSVTHANQILLEGCTGTASGATCELTCEDGYTPSNTPFELSCYKGKFSSTAGLECLPKECEVRPNVTNGRIPGRCTGTASGNTCDAECDDGYAALDTTVSCTLGDFDVSRVHCGPLPCYDVIDLDNAGDLSACNGTFNGKSCNVACADGYVVAGDSTLACSLGAWSVLNATCEPKACDAPPVVDKGTAGCESTESGSACPVTCPDGHTLMVGNHSWTEVECSFGMYEDAACVPNGCTASSENFPSDVQHLNLTAASVACADVEHNGHCMLECQEGYEVRGDTDDSLVCIAGAYLEHTTVCVPKGCVRPDRLHAIEEGLDKCHGPHGTQCVLACESGYSPTANTMVCEFGEWNDVVCKGNGCTAAPPIVHGSAEALEEACPGTESGESCPVACETGYDPSVESIPCTGDAWGTAECLPANCTTAPDDIPHMTADTQLDLCVGLDSGEACKFACEPGYVVDPPGATLLCHAGAFVPVSCAAAPCTTEPDIVHKSAEMECTGTVSSGSCSMVCANGYRPTAPTLRCELGEWQVNATESGEPVACVGLPCAEPPEVEHAADASHCIGKASGEDCTVACEEGYTAATNVVTCELGTFTGADFIQCVPKPCGDAPAVDHERELGACSNLMHNTTCDITCQDGYDVVGEFECLFGNFVSQPGCKGRPCVDAPTVANMDEERMAKCAATESGDSCFLRCVDGYEPIIEGGGHTMSCEGGAWDVVACKPKSCSNMMVTGAGAQTQCDGTESGNKCFALCPNGMKPSPDGAICNMGEWSGAIECKPLGCNTPPAACDSGTVCPAGGCMNCVEHAAPLVGCSLAEHGDLCPFTCVDGYAGTESTLRCDRGRWDWTTAFCKPEPCDAPTEVEHTAMASCKGTDSGEQCAIACEAGYSPAVGKTLATCNLGAWDHFACEPDGCARAPDIASHGPPGGLVCNDAADGDACEVSCRPGYEPDLARTPAVGGVPQVVCSAGQWMNARGVAVEAVPIRCVPKDCNKMAPNMNHVTPATKIACSDVEHDDECEIKCLDGYEPAVGTIMCELGTFKFSGEVCRPASCNEYPMTTHVRASSVTQCDGLPHLAKCHLECLDGYEPTLNGVRQQAIRDGADRPSAALTCMKGTWTPDEYKCVEKGCYSAPSIPDGDAAAMYECAGSSHGAQCLVQCHGYDGSFVPKVFGLTVKCFLGEWQLHGNDCVHPEKQSAMVSND